MVWLSGPYKGDDYGWVIDFYNIAPDGQKS